MRGGVITSVSRTSSLRVEVLLISAANASLRVHGGNLLSGFFDSILIAERLLSVFVNFKTASTWDNWAMCVSTYDKQFFPDSRTSAD
ncbi:hypothetical protein I7I53_10197 [Histoplasma capsulatum var. duboisii H88]|uniref:Uncharacterized protein n=1 Tax=Ajellomyces capsulatus (strain H88) TaxID=544711 RepID=A0A8A1L730_AJEC8|nr:hypothetical protein I7I53_10197 [Histoplasma capsulatum var. duboisii H88]